jgi:hypothetical protein
MDELRLTRTEYEAQRLCRNRLRHKSERPLLAYAGHQEIRD